MSDDLRREVDKIIETLQLVEKNLEHQARANAALHASDRVMFSPLHAKVQAALFTADVLREKISGNDA